MKKKFFRSAERCYECGKLILDGKPHNHKKIITIIELLNMVANEEKLPKRIIWGKHEFEKVGTNYIALGELGHPSLCEVLGNLTESILNDEIEIIEESEEHNETTEEHNIGKLNDILTIDDPIPPYDENIQKIWRELIKTHNKINEIIDKINGDSDEH